MERPGERRELVYCHGCENEFYKDQHGLTCPRCRSDFTEILEDRRSDPREQNPMLTHNPWMEAPDPDEDDITRYASPHSPPGMSFGGRFDRSGPGSPRPFQPGMQPGPPVSPLVDGILRMVQNIGGYQNADNFGHSPRSPGFEEPPRERARSTPGSPGRRGGGGGGGGGGSSNFSFSFSSTTVGPGGPRTYHYSSGGAEPLDFNEVFGSMLGGPTRSAGIRMGGSPFGGAPFGPGAGPFGSMGAGAEGPREMRGGTPGAGGPGISGLGGLFDLLQALSNPANARFGDAVYSQEALDRIMTQLMDEHQSGNAPGPAAQSAIDSLPRKPATQKHIGEGATSADCSICMETVNLGDEIVELPCHHWFHFECAKAWLGEHDTCPICRSGITPKEGDRNTVREPGQAPLHDESPAHIARRQSGTRDHPYIVPESPTSDRRRPPQRRYSSSSSTHHQQQQQQQSPGGAAGGLAGRLRNFLGRGDSSSGTPPPNGNGR